MEKQLSIYIKLKGENDDIKYIQKSIEENLYKFSKEEEIVSMYIRNDSQENEN